ncbi:MAG TPA: O-antigen ligase family protein [Polyangiaceae bacterium]|nr:O-antigen ligase family protein [Polyangiaceae bacterium]
MFAIPGIIALVVFIYARPQEFFERLRVVPLLYLFFGLAVFGLALDLRLSNSRLRATPQLPWVAAFFVWSTLTVLIQAPSSAIDHVTALAICVALYLLIAHGVQSFRTLHVVAGSVLCMVLLVCSVGAHQGFADTGCVIVDESVPGDTASGKPDGRPCVTPRNCYTSEAEPGAEYQCEHVGLFGTTSIGHGRVRYRGVLQDPNELALAGGVGLPLAFAFSQASKRSLSRWLLAAISFVLVLVCAVLTASRGGQLVFLAVLAAYFVKRAGLVGLLLGGVLAAPLLLLGGRGGEDASSSTLERIDCWAEALSMWRSHPFLGVGLGQFNEYHYMTAHNSYLLALAELGFPGMLLFGIILYLSAKIPVVALARLRAAAAEVSDGVQLTRAWSIALLAASVGLAVGIFFLSFTYHYVLWIYVGLCGALYSAIRRHDASFRVRLSWADLAIVALANVAIIVLVFFYTRWKLA